MKKLSFIKDVFTLKKILLVAFLSLYVIDGFATDTILYNKPSIKKIGAHLEILDNRDKKYDVSTITNAKEFYENKRASPVFSKLDIDIWIRFSIVNCDSFACEPFPSV